MGFGVSLAKTPANTTSDSNETEAMETQKNNRIDTAKIVEFVTLREALRKFFFEVFACETICFVWDLGFEFLICSFFFVSPKINKNSANTKHKAEHNTGEIIPSMNTCCNCIEIGCRIE